MKKSLYGVVCATITPLNQKGELDTRSLESLGEYLYQNGIQGLYPNGTNGEGLLLTKEERQIIATVLTKQNSARMSVYIQCTAVSSEETAEHLKQAESIGAHGAGVMTPVFFQQDDQALYHYYESALQQVGEGFPVYVYNIPSHANNDVSPQLFEKLMKNIPNIKGIKFSAPDLFRIQDYLSVTGGKADVLIGCDRLFLQCLVSGGVGTVSGPAMVFAKRFVKLYKQFLSGDYEGAIFTQQKIVETDRALMGIPGIPAIKTMLRYQGVIQTENCREPFRPLTDEEKNTLYKLVDDYNIETEGGLA